jgi:hypothetical protein
LSNASVSLFPHKVKAKSVTDVILIIYDVLGKKITILVNEQLSPGIYETERDGSQYTSGV